MSIREPMTLRKLIDNHRRRDGNDDFLDLPITFSVSDGMRNNQAHDDMKDDEWPSTFRAYADYAGELRFNVRLHGLRLVKTRRT